MLLTAARWFVVLVFVAALGAPSIVVAGDSDSTGNTIKSVAARMTDEAIAAGVDGRDDLRAELLQKAVTVDPAYAPARWELGQIQVGDRWMPIATAQNLASSDAVQMAYRDRLVSIRDVPQQHLDLARWCKENQLTDEARFHWLRVLEADRANREALGALNSVWYRGSLVSVETAERLKLESLEQIQLDRHWQDRTTKWLRQQKGKSEQQASSLHELHSEVDESAIRTFESLAAKTKRWDNREGSARLALCVAFTKAISQHESFAATETLVRHALYADHPQIRSVASQQLSDRPLHECVPLLLDGFAPSIDSRYAVRISPSGRIIYNHELVQAGPDGVQIKEVAKSSNVKIPISWRANFTNSPYERNKLLQRQNRDQNQQRARDYRKYQSDAAKLEAAVAKTNRDREVVNGRVFAALSAVTGKEFGSDIDAWANYWREHNEYSAPSYRPPQVYRDTYYYEHFVPKYYSCFEAGTLVSTKTGNKEIETLRPGELVLVQDVATGELHYRPVLECTVRDPSPMLSIQVGSESIRTTLGHPFWVAGKGWRMAKELEPGDRLATVSGPAVVDMVTQSGEDTAYNLVVDSAANYFVGRTGLLVHDNTPRRADQERAGISP